MLITGPGAGGAGIDGGAKIAKDMGFETVGVVSDAIMEYGAPSDPAFDKIAVVASNGSWGGAKPDCANKNARDLKGADMEAVSHAMVMLGTRPGAQNISYGGGTVAQQECCALANSGGQVSFVPCQINHAKAIAKAAKNGAALPTKFDGEFSAFLRAAKSDGQSYPGISVVALARPGANSEPVGELIAKVSGVATGGASQLQRGTA